MLVYQYENRSGYVTGNMGNLFHDFIIIPFSTSNFLLKVQYFENQKSCLGEIKSIFHKFLWALFWSNVKN